MGYWIHVNKNRFRSDSVIIYVQLPGPLGSSLTLSHVHLEQTHKHCGPVPMERGGAWSVGCASSLLFLSLSLCLLVICARRFGLLPSLMMHGTLASHYPKIGWGPWHFLVKEASLFGFRIAWPTKEGQNKVCCLFWVCFLKLLHNHDLGSSLRSHHIIVSFIFQHISCNV